MRTIPTQQEAGQLWLTLRDNSNEIVWDSWEALPKVRPGLYYVIDNAGAVEKHKTNVLKDSHNFYIKGEPTTRITQVRKDTDMPEFLTRPMKLDEVVETSSKFIQVYAVVLIAPKYVYNDENGKAKQELRIVDDTGTSHEHAPAPLRNAEHGQLPIFF